MTQELSVFIAKINRISFHKVEGNTLSSTSGFQVSVNTLYHHNGLQVCIYVRYNDSHVATYGSQSDDDNHQIATWFYKLRQDAVVVETKLQETNAKVGKTLFV